MGNCFSCYKVPPPADAPQTTSMVKDKEGDMMEPQHLFCRTTDVHRHSFSSLDHHSNGNSKLMCPPVGSDNVGSLHRDKSLRTFYARIQPLGRTSSSCPNNNEVKQKEVSEVKLNALFELYRDTESPDYILAEGVERLLHDLNLSPNEFKVLVLAWKLNAENMCQFSREEFVEGLRGMHTDSLKSISNRLPDLTNEVVSNPELFKDLYRFTFRFGLDKATGQRILPSDMAIGLWRIVFSLREPPILEKWLKFLECHPNVRGIPRDTWNMFLNLSESLGNDLSCYDDSEAWPSVFDDFVEFENDTMNQNISKDKEELIQDCT